MHQVVLFLHVLIAFLLTLLILLQHGKGADAGAAFGGGASGTVFGARGAATFLSRSTAVLALLFVITSLSLAHFIKQQTPTSVTTGMSATESSDPVNNNNAVDTIATDANLNNDADVSADNDIPTIELDGIADDLPMPDSQQ